jgi:RNA polymerase sigma-70 factor (ECF subfamily)
VAIAWTLAIRTGETLTRCRTVGDAPEVMVDRAHFETFVQEYQDMVYGTAIRLVANAAEAEDIAQTVFLKAFERFDAIGANPAAPGWLKTVTTNLCLNHLARYRSRWRFFSELRSREADDDEQQAVDALMVRAGTTTAPNVEADLASNAEAEQLEEALRSLPANQRVPIVLFHFENKSYVEIAALLGVSVAKVKTDIHRGREKLRSVIQARHASR